MIQSPIVIVFFDSPLGKGGGERGGRVSKVNHGQVVTPCKTESHQSHQIKVAQRLVAKESSDREKADEEFAEFRVISRFW